MTHLNEIVESSKTNDVCRRLLPAVGGIEKIVSARPIIIKMRKNALYK